MTNHSIRLLSIGTALGVLSATASAQSIFTDEILPEESIIQTKLEASKHLLSWQRGVTDHSTYILGAYQEGLLKTGKIYLSGHASYSFYAEQTDTEGKFPILGRFPGQHQMTGKKSSEKTIDNIDLSLTYAPTSWLSAYARGTYTELEYPGQEEKQLREAFVNFGDLSRFPVYLSVGKKTINFGNFQSYNPTTHTVSNHFYRADSSDIVAELGYMDSNSRIAFTAMKGGRQLRVADTPDNNYLENFAISGQHRFDIDKNTNISVGGGYLYSTIYDSDSANHPGQAPDPLTVRKRNGAYDAWIEAKHNNLSFMAEYTKTERDWPATGAPVEALTLQAAYDAQFWGKDTRFSAVYGRGKQGNDGDQFETLHQAILGGEMFITPNFSLSAEYVYNRGFVPLIMISRASDKDVDTHTLILSGKVFF